MKLSFWNMSGQHLAWIRGRSVRKPLTGEKRGKQVHTLGVVMGVHKKKGISLVNCSFGGWKTGKEKVSGLVSNMPREYGLMDKVQLSWSKQHDKDNCMIYI